MMPNPTPPTSGPARPRGSRPATPPPPPESLASDGIDARALLRALGAFREGDFSVRLPEHWPGLGGRIADAFNDVVVLNQRMAKELERLSRVVGKQGRIAERANVGDVSGAWATSMGCVNSLIGDLTYPLAETSRVIGAVA